MKRLMGVTVVFATLLAFVGLLSLRSINIRSAERAAGEFRGHAKPPGNDGNALSRRGGFSDEIAEWRHAFSAQRVRSLAAGSKAQDVVLAARIIDTSARPALDVPVQKLTSRGTAPYLVQFEGPVADAAKTELEQSGAVIRGYIPNHAFLVEVAPEVVPAVAAIPSVRWMGEYRPEDKVQPFLRYVAQRLAERAAEEPAGDVEWPKVEVSVRTLAPEDVKALTGLLRDLSAEVLHAQPGRRWGLVRARITPSEAVLAQLASRGEVQWVEEFLPRVMHNDFAVRSDHMNVTNVWYTHGLTGRRQVIGHADTGLDVGTLAGLHPDFMGRIRVAIARGRPGNWSDPDGHGTHTAGSVLGSGAGSAGQFRGVAYEAELVHQSVLDAGGGLGGLPADLYELYLEAYTNSARIHSDSWGSSVYGQYTVDSQSSDEFMWDYPDMLLIFSAGNDGRDLNNNGVVDPDSIGAPATAKNMVTVGAAESDRAPGTGGYTGYSWGYAWGSKFGADPIKNDYISQSADGIRQGIAAFSSRGPTDDGRFKPDLVAPGTDVISARSRAPGAGTGWGAHPNTNYAFSGGTSMSTPLIAGAAALVRQFFMERQGMTNPSAALVKAALLNGARSLTPGQYGTNATREIPPQPRPNNVEGWGQADLARTLFPTAPVRITADDTNRLSTGITNVYALFIGHTNMSRVTLAYSDYPASAGAGKKLVNDLDLRVTAPGGSNYFPNGFSGPDRTNNVEGIDFVPAVSGVYTVRVSGFNVPFGPQPYALVFSGGWEPVFAASRPNTTNTTDTIPVEAMISSLRGADTGTFRLYWNTNASVRFHTGALARVEGPVYRGFIPPQPEKTTVYYYFEAQVDGGVRRYPSNAPASLLSFRVTPPVYLTVTGTPAEIAAPAPAYGIHAYAENTPVTASVTAFSEPVAGTRYASMGWLGSGSVPPTGAMPQVAFVMTTNSKLNWQWSPQYALTQSGSLAGILSTTNWVFAGATADTITAAASVMVGSTNYRFAQWVLDGVRHPDPTNRAVNPVTGIVMGAPRTAVAVYLPVALDSDGNGLPDWWEMYYFGNTGVMVSADADGDLFSNEMEFLDDSDPRDAGSIPTPPEITHSVISTPQPVPAPWRVAAGVTDSGTVTSVSLIWSRNGGVPSTTAFHSAGANLYTNAIPAPGVSGDSFSYTIVARDAAGLSTINSHAFIVAYGIGVLAPTNFGTIWLRPGGTSNVLLHVENDGHAELLWSLQQAGASSNDGWWTIYPTNGLLTDGIATSVVVSLNATGLTNGAVRSGSLVFRSNDPTRPSNSVPLTLRVGLPPVIAPLPVHNTTNLVDPYAVEADLIPFALVNTNRSYVLWTTSGVEGPFVTGAMSRVAGDRFRALIPAQPVGTRIHYYFDVTGTNGLGARHPTNAPDALLSFDVVGVVSLVVTGAPLEVGNVNPVYGIYLYPSGTLINAQAEAEVLMPDKSWYTSSGWMGYGSVPVSGATQEVSFVLNEDSELNWQWDLKYALYQSASEGWFIWQPSLWTPGSMAETLAAPESFLIGDEVYRFGQWNVDGERYPASGVAMNPATDIHITTTSRYAKAYYYPESLDSDGDGLPDWWAARYGFGFDSNRPVAHYVFDRRFGDELVLDGTGHVYAGEWSWDTSDSFSMAFWVRPSVVTGTHGMFGHSVSPEWAWEQQDAHVAFLYFDAGGGTSLALRATNVMEISRWRHVAVSYHSGLGEGVLYVDGLAVATSMPASAFSAVGGNAVIGRAMLPPGVASAFAGRVDDVAIWSRALGAKEVADLALRGVLSNTDLELLFAFNADGGGMAFDDSGNERHGTYSNGAVTAHTTLAWDSSGNGHHGMIAGAAWQEDLLNGWKLDFDGDQWVVVPHAPGLMPTSAITMTAWAKADALYDYHTLLVKVSDETWVDGYGLYGYGLGSTDLVAFVNHFWTYHASAPTTTGAWTHLAATYDNVSLVAYADGAAGVTNAVAGGIIPNSGPLYIGGYEDEWGFEGSIMEVRLYTNALDAIGLSRAGDALSDADGDGFSNRRECLDGTDPLDSGSMPSPPVIVHSALADPQTMVAPWPVSAVVTDNAAVVSVHLWWRRNASEWQRVGMVADAVPDTFVAVIPLPESPGDHFEYRIEAADGAGLSSTNGPHTFEVEYPVIGIEPANLELNWLAVGEMTQRTLTITNSGNAPLAWQIAAAPAGLEDDVEWGAGGWTHGGIGNHWRVSTNRSYSPTHAWYCGFFGEPGYDNGMNVWLLSPPIRVVQGAGLEFRYWADTEIDEGFPPYAFDGGVVEISTDGTNFIQITPIGGYPYIAHGLYGSPFASGTPIFAGTGSWQRAEFDMTAYAGQDVRVRFRFGSDEAFAVGEGWYVDDILLRPAFATGSWFNLSTTSGVIGVATAADVIITLDAAELSDGDRFAALLEVLSNDPVSPLHTVPLSLFVGEPVIIVHDPLLNTTNSVDDYIIAATLEPQGLFDTNDLVCAVLWNTNGPGHAFATNVMTTGGENVWIGIIPAQPLGTEVYYYLQATVAGVGVSHPADAPANLHRFAVSPPVRLEIMGFPETIGLPVPPYGVYTYAWGTMIHASVQDVTNAGVWFQCEALIGNGSVPPLLLTNALSFSLEADSFILWWWATHYQFVQSSSPEGIIDSTVWVSELVTTSTVLAAASHGLESVDYRFTGWTLNGERQSGTLGKAINPVVDIVMTSAQTAVAGYLPVSQDSDGDGLPDWWELFYFGTLDWGPNDDPDGDGYGNFAEYGDGTDPTDITSVPAPPAILHTPLADPQTSIAPWLVSAVVTDNARLADTSVAGSALRFNGVSDHAIKQAMKSFPTSAITVEFWMKSSDKVRRGTPISYAVAGDFNDANEFTLYNYNTFLIYRGAVYTNTQVGATDGQWTHVAVTWRGSDGQTRLYKNGTLEFDGALSPGVPIRPEGILVLAQDQDSYGGGFSGDDAFEGLMDELRVWNVVRSGDEIRETMSNRLWGTEAGLIGYWRFDEGSDTIAYDMAAPANHFTLVGAKWTNSDAFVSADVQLSWARNGGDWQYTIMSPQTADQFMAYIPAPGINGDAFAYEIRARDAGGLWATNGPHAFTVGHPDIELAPRDISDIWMLPDATTGRVLVVSNAGLGTLSWTLQTESQGLVDDVESGTNNWMHSGPSEQWHITAKRSFSPTHSWYCGDETAGTYLNNMDARLDTPPVALGAGAKLSFSHWADLEMQSATVAWDGAVVELSTNSGESFTRITPVGGYPYSVNGGFGQPLPAGIGVFAGVGGWTQAVFDLSSYAGHEAIIRFRMGSDVVNDYLAEGWFIDDIVVTPTEGTNDWLLISATNGVVESYSATNLTLTFDSAGMTSGARYAKSMIISANDPSEPVSRIPVVLSVGVQPLIVHTPFPNTAVTSGTYAIEAAITPAAFLNTNELKVFWNTNGSLVAFSTALMARATGDVYRALLPAQPMGTRVHYYLSAMAGVGLITTEPSDAPAVLHMFEVAQTRNLLVTGTPLETGFPSPTYGLHALASGAVVQAFAGPAEPVSGTRYSASGWLGSGSVPATGSTHNVTFALLEDSILDWQWSVQYELSQTSTVRGAVETSSWWFAGATGETVVAPWAWTLQSTNYVFAQWVVDGARQPDATNPAVNPAASIIMSAARSAAAVYLPAELDLDGDDLADWWEYRYFGSLTPWRSDDPDGDGFSNLMEYHDRTDPRDASSFPVPPVIQHVPLPSPKTAGAPWQVTAVVTDNFMVANATLWWRRNSDAWQSSNMTLGVSDQYAAIIAGPATDGDVFNYRVEATDAAGLRTTNGPHAFAVLWPVLTLNPTNLQNILVVEGTMSNVFLQVLNSGGGTLGWTAAVWRVGLWDDVESGAGAWSHDGAGDLWHISTNRAASPIHSWYGGSVATREYGNGMDSRLVSEPVLLGPSAQLTFKHFMDSELKDSQYAYDGGVVEISTNGGVTYARITPVGGYPYRLAAGTSLPAETPCFAGTGGWQTVTFSLAAHAGKTARFRFRFVSDSSKAREGWYVDDIAVYPGTGDGAWLELQNNFGELGPSVATLVTVSLNAVGLPGGTRWPAEIAVTSTDPLRPLQIIPISMAVLGVWSDLDGDGMPDLWEYGYGFDPLNPDDAALDWDGDDFSNRDEYIAGTDPLDDESYFRMTNVTSEGGRGVEFLSISGRIYSLFAATSFYDGVWWDMVTQAPGSNGLVTLVDTNTAARRYYRIGVEPDP